MVLNSKKARMIGLTRCKKTRSCRALQALAEQAVSKPTEIVLAHALVDVPKSGCVAPGKVAMDDLAR